MVVFVPDPVAWTEAPESARVLGRQRDRWHRGLADTLWRHRRLLLNPRYGPLGLVSYPYFLFIELLAPLVEVFGVLALPAALALHAVNWQFALLLFLVAYCYGLWLTSCSPPTPMRDSRTGCGWRNGRSWRPSAIASSP